MKQKAMIAFFAKHEGIHSVHQSEVPRANTLVKQGFLIDHGNKQYQFSGKVFT